MLFNSAQFLVFFPVVALLYFAIPQRVKHLWLLAASYYFYMCWNPRYAILIAVSTAITYLSGLLIAKDGAAGRKKLWVALSFVLNLSILFFFKYFVFAVQTAVAVVFALSPDSAAALGDFLTPKFTIILPVGISFYTFQALSYTVDVYRGEVEAEKDFFRYALFVSFFPQLVAGPIERSKNLLGQMREGGEVGLSQGHFELERVRNGLLLMLWGFFLKLVIADRVAVLVNTVFGDYTAFTGLQLGLAAVFFSVQIYCDFGGYSVIAIGAAEVMGFRLMENFKRPYFALSIRDFWRRWHISLSTWFRDYLYIPLGGSRAGKGRKYVNLMVTFLVSGLWHGASWHYVAWGGLHGLYQVLGDALRPLRSRLLAVLHIPAESRGWMLVRGLFTFALVTLAWIFFRADSVPDAFHFIALMCLRLGDGIGSVTAMGLDKKDFFVALGSIAFLLLADGVQSRCKVRERLAAFPLAVRWAVYYLAIFVVLILGVYGPNYDASAFIYFQF